FSLIATGATRGRMDAVSWIWVETTLLSAAVLAGAWLAGLRTWVAGLVGAITIAGLAWASRGPLVGVWRLGRWAAEEGRSAVSHAGQVLAIELVVLVRARPLIALGVALAVGAVFGLVIGLALGRASNRGRS